MHRVPLALLQLPELFSYKNLCNVWELIFVGFHLEAKQFEYFKVDVRHRRKCKKKYTLCERLNIKKKSLVLIYFVIPVFSLLTSFTSSLCLVFCRTCV